MEDITDSILVFKEAIRHVWNVYFSKSDSPMSPEIQEAFEAVERGLFEGIVLIPLGLPRDKNEYRKYPLSSIQVKSALHARELPIRFGVVKKPGYTVWELPTKISVEDAPIMEFFDFFNWDFFGQIDLPYVRVRIAVSPTIPNAVGSYALIEQQNCRFVLATQE